MKKHIYFLFTLFLLVGCSDNECSLQDWEGTYIGTTSCKESGQSDYTFTITIDDTPKSTPNTIVLDGYRFIVDGCDIVSAAPSSTYIPDPFRASLDGNKLKLSLGKLNGTCSYNATKQ